jgi:hypothetical protein
VSQQSTNRSFDDLARALAEGSISRRGALRLFAGTAIAALIPSRALAQQQKVIICHKPETPDEKTIEVSQSAVPSHVRHGDTLGACESPTTTTTAAPTTTSTTSTTETPTTSTSTTPMCIPLGIGPCNDPDQCCGLSACEGGTCCASGNQVCNADSECCGDFTCQEGQCLPVCLPDGAVCGTDSPPPCCNGVCVNGACCQSTGGQCDTDSQCCTGACLSGTCTDCMPNDSQCTTDTECCNGNCFLGFCVPRNRIQCGCENGAAGACTSTDCSDATAVNQLCTDLCAQLGQGAVPELSECIPEGCVS